MNNKLLTNLRMFATFLVIILCININAEKRYYFTRGGDLPVQQGLETVDLRPGMGNASITNNQIALDENYNYTFYTKTGAAWFSFDQRTTVAVDMSDINADFDNWYLKVKIATTFDSPEFNIGLNNQNTANNPFNTQDLPRDGEWHTLVLKLSDYNNGNSESLKNSYTSAYNGIIFQMHAGEGVTLGTTLAIDYAYLTNDPTGVDNGTAECQDCIPLDTPVITNIDADGTITFNTVPNAAGYRAYVYKDDISVYAQAVSSGDKLSFTSFQTYTYTVKLQAIAEGGTSYLDSELSASVNWFPEAAPLGESEMCYIEFSPTSGNNIYFTWQTESDGSIIITIDDGDGANLSFRGSSPNLANTNINDQLILNYFTKTVNGATCTLTPIEGAQIAPGDKITGSIGLEWSPNNAYGTYTNLEYTYGTRCEEIPVKRYYLLSNENTPTSGPYEIIDYTADINHASELSAGWETARYAGFPFYTIDGTQQNVSFQFAAIKGNISFENMNDAAGDAWYLKTKIRTNTTGTVKISMFDCNGDEYIYTIPETAITGEWAAVNVSFAEFIGIGEASYSCVRPVNAKLFKVVVEGAEADEFFHMAYVYLTNENNAAISDPDPNEPVNPDIIRYIYLINDGNELPEGENIVSTDYRLSSGNITYELVSQSVSRDESVEYLHLDKDPDNAWFSTNLRATDNGVNLTELTAGWYINMKIKTNLAGRYINALLYPTQGSRGIGILNEERLPVSKNGEWVEIEVPLSEYDPDITFPHYTAGNVFSLHGDDNVVDFSGEGYIAVEYLYFTNRKKNTDPGTGTGQLQPEADGIIVNCFNRTLQVSNPDENSTVRIVDLSGKTVLRTSAPGNTLQMELNLPAGIYLVEVISGNLPKKVVKILL